MSPSDEQAERFFDAVALAYYKGRLELHGHSFPVMERSGASLAAWRFEEDGYNARESLEHLVGRKDHPFMKEAGLDTWQKRLMYFLKPVARHFGVNDETLLQRYMRHNLPTHMLEAGIDPTPFLGVKS